MPLTITVLTATTCLITGAKWFELHREMPNATYPTSPAVTLWSADGLFLTGCERESGGNAPGTPVTITTSRCGRTILLAHSGVDRVWIETGYYMDRDADGSVGSGDFFSFLTAFFSGAPEADYDGDGKVTSADALGWLECFLGG
jgi:hypothetical protein